MVITANLTDWSIVYMYGSYVVLGTISGTDSKGRFQDGDKIRSSSLQSVDFVNGIATTLNSVYKLL